MRHLAQRRPILVRQRVALIIGSEAVYDFEMAVRERDPKSRIASGGGRLPTAEGRTQQGPALPSPFGQEQNSKNQSTLLDNAGPEPDRVSGPERRAGGSAHRTDATGVELQSGSRRRGRR
ncbi:MAG: hypothetical protein AAGG11_17230, partial [Pseudomonadota bacterium]